MHVRNCFHSMLVINSPVQTIFPLTALHEFIVSIPDEWCDWRCMLQEQSCFLDACRLCHLDIVQTMLAKGADSCASSSAVSSMLYQDHFLGQAVNVCGNCTHT